MSQVLVDVAGPADDPFYRVPENVERFSPGEVLDSRHVEVRLFRRLINADAWQVKFRSTGTDGAAVSGVTTVMIPRRRFKGSARPLLSYQCAIDSLGATADPSYMLRHGYQMELPLMLLALRRGWAVVTTDHNGPDHASFALPLVARFVLDGIRAAVAFEPAESRRRHADRSVGLLGRRSSNPFRGRTTARLRAGTEHRGRRRRGRRR